MGVAASHIHANQSGRYDNHIPLTQLTREQCINRRVSEKDSEILYEFDCQVTKASARSSIPSRLLTT